MKFILTADDYGISPLIDDAIEEAAKAGVITTVAAFANKRASAPGEPIRFDVSKIADFQKRFEGKVSVGMHFTVTSGPRVCDHAESLSPKKKKRRRRRFKGVGSQMINAKEQDVYDELKAQLRLFQEAEIKISHFSDHHGIISHTKKGRKALFKVVSEYNREMNLRIPIRNPLFTSTLINNTSNCLDNSKAAKGAQLPVSVQNIARLIFKSRRKREKGKFQLSLKALSNFVTEMNKMGIPTTDYFVDSFWSAFDESVPRCVFNPDNYIVKPNLLLPLDSAEPTVEFMLHIAQTRDQFQGNYDQEIENIKAHGGIDPGYVQKGRLHEARLLHDFVKKHTNDADRKSFAPYLQPIH